MSPTELRFRQVHLDFHTSPDIPDVGADFDPDEFADTLARAHVNSINCFARGHHGLIYYDSKVNPERVHPHLARRDLLREQIEACHRRDIRVPIYTTVQWDDFTAREHRDWLLLDDKGVEGGATLPFQSGFYRFLDVFHPGYRAFLQAHLKEILETLPVDGVWLDIVQPRPSVAPHWLDAMDDAGLDPEDAEARARFAAQVIDDWQHETTAFIRRYHKDCLIFYNAGHIGPRHRTSVKAYTHYELESLPSGGWGYLHFPLTIRYARGLGHDCLGMTGKFHTSWGDFHSFKNPAALEFECFNMLALGATCCVGDQLHPRGRIDPATYDLIGRVYAQVERKEPWCRGARPVTEIGVFTPEGMPGRPLADHHRVPDSAAGAVLMLQELRLQFDVIDPERDLAAYRLLILPDNVPVDAALAAKLEAFVAAGGALLASHRSGLAPEGDRFATDLFGATLKSEAPFSPDFLVPGEPVRAGLEPTGYVMYLRGLEVAAAGGAEVLADVQVPYFNRTWRHFCSHRHTPSSGRVGYPGIVRQGRCIYFMHPVFTQYRASAPRWCKRLVANGIGLLLPDPLLTADGPSTLQATLNHQAAEHRYVVHLLHYIPERRGQAFDTVEDVIPLYDTALSVALPKRVKTVRLVPQDAALHFTQAGGRVAFTVPEVAGHQMVEIATA